MDVPATTTDNEATRGPAGDGERLAQQPATSKRRSPPRGADGAGAAGGKGIFRPFTPESLQRIRTRIDEENRAKELAKKQQEEDDAAAGADGKQGGGGDANKKEEEEPEPNAMFEAGKTLPDRLGTFPPSLYGKPIEDLDDFYDDKYVNHHHRCYCCSFPCSTVHRAKSKRKGRKEKLWSSWRSGAWSASSQNVSLIIISVF